MALQTETTVAAMPDYQHPQDLEAEEGLLGSIVLDNSAMGEVHQIVDKECFYNTNHQIIFKVMIDLYDARKPIDSVILKDELIKKGMLEKIGGIDKLTTILDSVPTAANAIHYARIIREKYILRSIMLTCNQILRKAAQATVESDILLDEAQRLIFEVARKRDVEKSIQISDILKTTFDKIMDARDRKSRLVGLSTGLKDLDDMVGGLQGGQFIVVAGRPSSGKSSFALRLMEQVGLVEAKPIVFYTLEVTSQQVVQNLLCSHARVNSRSLRSGFISDEELQRLMMAAGRFDETKIFIDDSSDLSAFELKARARRLKADYDIQLLIVDYLQLMRIKEVENRQLEIAFISYSLKSLAKELDIPVVAMAQLSREAERRETKQPRPRLSDLRESGAIEQDADVVLLLYRDELYNPPTPETENICEINIAKQRNGPTGEKRFAFSKEFTRFEDLYEEK